MKIIVGNNLKHFRKSKGFSQEQVSDYLHISQSAYARMESGESHSWAIHIARICQIFEISPEELVKSDRSIIDNDGVNSGVGYFEIVSQLSEKLIEQYEERIRELKQTIVDLKVD
jgi:transcriptional regulator with XRE-family HTH domain